MQQRIKKEPQGEEGGAEEQGQGEAAAGAEGLQDRDSGLQRAGEGEGGSSRPESGRQVGQDSEQ